MDWILFGNRGRVGIWGGMMGSLNRIGVDGLEHTVWGGEWGGGGGGGWLKEGTNYVSD